MAVPRVPTYIDGFDQALGGGIPKGSVVLVCGTPGTLKSSLCFSILYHNVKAGGSKGLYVTLEESQEEFRVAMEELGMRDLEELELYVLDLSRIRREHREEEMGKDWLQALTSYIDQRLRDEGFDLLVIDSLAALYSLSKLENPRRDLFHFVEFLKGLGTTTFLISEMETGSSKLSHFSEDFLADGILHLKHHEVGDTDVQLRIRCVKMRKTKHHHGYFALVRGEDSFVVTSVISEARV